MKKTVILKTLVCSSLLLASSSAFAAGSPYDDNTVSAWSFIFAFIVFVAGILQIILFFKIWIMTNNVKDIHNLYLQKGVKFTDAKFPYLLNRREEAFNILNKSTEDRIMDWIKSSNDGSSDIEKTQSLIDRDIEKIERTYYEPIGMEMPAEYKNFKIAQYVALYNKYKKETGSQEGAKPSQTSSNS